MWTLKSHPKSVWNVSKVHRALQFWHVLRMSDSLWEVTGGSFFLVKVALGWLNTRGQQQIDRAKVRSSSPHGFNIWRVWKHPCKHWCKSRVWITATNVHLLWSDFKWLVFYVSGISLQWDMAEVRLALWPLRSTAALPLLSQAFSLEWIKHSPPPFLYLNLSIYISLYLSLRLTHFMCSYSLWRFHKTYSNAKPGATFSHIRITARASSYSTDFKKKKKKETKSPVTICDV